MNNALPLLVSLVALSPALVAQGAQGADLPSPVSGSFGIDLTNQYFYRGIQQENQGFIIQPWVELSLPVYESDHGEVGSYALNFGSWNSLHTGPTGIDGGRQIWNESDFYVGLSTSLTEEFSVEATYTAYASPNGFFSTIQEIAFGVAYDDQKLWDSEFSGLQPHALLAFETDGQYDGGASSGIYLELGVTPSFTIDEELSLTIETPLTLGFSLSDYYEIGNNDDFFGYLDLGIDATMPVALSGSNYRPWDAHLGLHILTLGDNMETINGGDSQEILLSFGLSMSF